ncbi:uncharacterized protein LOC110017954 isoform X2 [Phalaenopsis equestris]|uniref:uncharacterized protein LOC110017954 isoform X2 n=1 Tax=Phalaenopsis equestris TaxID=78828 RepID=UPI0009E3809F|nr:uncharacterized protein LOC110017954 isoform X2 [Phalaenopsis equestris]
MPHSQLLPSSTPLSSSTAISKLLPSSLLPFRPLHSWARRSLMASTVPRPLFFSSVYAIWDALTGDAGGRARAASTAVRRGMLLFRQGNVDGSLAEFDRAIALDPRRKGYLWQRGLSLYYLNRFEEGADQFRLDVAENPNDTEESIWCFLCEAQIYGVDEARKRFLEVGQDSRFFMREVYNTFKDGGDPKKKEMNAAKRHIVSACQTPYGSRSDDYMAALAKVHCSCRNWSFS